MANVFSSDPNCAALWRFENGALTADSIGSNTLTESGTPVAEMVDFKEGAACVDLEVDDPDYFYCNDADLDAGFPLKSGDANKKVSFAFWFKAESYRTSVGSRFLINKGVAGTYSFRAEIYYTGAVNKLYVSIGYNNGNNLESHYDNYAFLTGRWYHVGVTFEDSSKAIKFRVWDDTAGAVVINYSSTTANNINVENARFEIGVAGTSYQWDGLIDELVVFKDILTVAEIDEIRNGTYGGTPPPPPVRIDVPNTLRYKYTVLSSNTSLWGVPFSGTHLLRLDRGAVRNVGGGVVEIGYHNNPFRAGDTIRIEGSTNYDGTHTLIAGTNQGRIRFASAYTAEILTGDETIVRQETIAGGAGRMCQDSDGNLYLGHNWSATWGYVTRIAPDGTFTSSLSFLNPVDWPIDGDVASTCLGVAVIADYLYIWIQEPGATSYGLMQQYDLVSGDKNWGTFATDKLAWPNYDMAVDPYGNAFAIYASGIRKYDKSTGAQVDLTSITSIYNLVSDYDLGLLIGAVANDLYVREYDNSDGDSLALACDDCQENQFIATDGSYIYVLGYDSVTPTFKLFKVSYGGGTLSLVSSASIAVPYAAGLYLDAYGNLVVVNQDWVTNQTDIFWFYDTDLNYLGLADGFYNSMLKQWEPLVGNGWIKGDVFPHPGPVLAGAGGKLIMGRPRCSYPVEARHACHRRLFM